MSIDSEIRALNFVASEVWIPWNRRVADRGSEVSPKMTRLCFMLYILIGTESSLKIIFEC
jgi:hypothetical protein